MNIYVGNVPYAATEADLEKIFEPHGPIKSVTIIRDRHDGRSKGYGFVEMENQEDGERATEALDGHELMGRRLTVNPARPRQDRAPSRERQQHGDPNTKQSDASDSKKFHNPYTFVPSPPRQEAIKQGGFAGDFNPLECGLDHASLKDNLWTGHIPIKLTTVTPLVLLKGDGEDRSTDTHQTYDVLDYLPESSLRGMLRSAYEVVTNSRYACFGNDDRLAYRMDTREAAKLIPTIIENVSGKLVANLYPGTSDVSERGPMEARSRGPMYAAMLGQKTKYVGGGEPKTRDEVWAEIDRRRHHRFQDWKVVKVWLKSKCPSKPSSAGKIIDGKVFTTNENIKGKHDERVFFNRMSKTFPVSDGVKNAWRMRIQSYQDAHRKEEIFHRKDRNGNSVKAWEKIGNRPGETAWSPHLYENGKHTDRWGRQTHDALTLQEGAMVYARCKFDSNGNVKTIEDLFPVMISRELYPNSPKDLLDPLLLPASSRNELSPADRLFGWVPQKSERKESDQETESGYKSRIRVVCENGERPKIIESIKDGPLPLAILGQPKPAQGRFYVAKDIEGRPQHDVKKENAGYEKNGNKRLRGRKQYWHHKGLEANKAKAYWHPSAEDRTREKHDDRYQEYRRPNEGGKKDGKPKNDSQNRFINGWIKPGTEFKVSLYVQNLEPQEMGALLWLLSLNDGIPDRDAQHYFRLGYGKPLGFGSVKMEIDCPDKPLPLGTGEDWKKYYTAFDTDTSPPAALKEDKQTKHIQKYQESMEKAYPDQVHYEKGQKRTFNNLRFISGFLQVLLGPKLDVPIHYPRTDEAQLPEGKNFEWFVDNDHYNYGMKLALPDVTDEEGLPYKPKT